MTIYSNAKVEEIRRVLDSAGNKVAPATENLQASIDAALSNRNGATIQTYTTGGTTAEQLPDLTIPDGVTALVAYLPGNSGDVYLGDDTDQFIPLTDPGHVFSWEGSNINDLHIRTNSAGDGVGIIFEGAQ